MKVSHFPLRVAIGAFFINSGLSKWSLEGQAVDAAHGMAVGAVPALRRFSPRTFARLLAGSETALGVAMMVPKIPSAVVGAGLCGFAGGLMRLYWVTPGTHQPGSPRPTQQGVPLAKDTWLIGAGLTLILDDLIGGRRRGRRACGCPGRGRHGRGGHGPERHGHGGHGHEGHAPGGHGHEGHAPGGHGHGGHGHGGHGHGGHGHEGHAHNGHGRIGHRLAGYGPGRLGRLGRRRPNGNGAGHAGA